MSSVVNAVASATMPPSLVSDVKDVAIKVDKQVSEVAAAPGHPILRGLSIVLSLATIGVAVYLLMEMQKKGSA